jgi:hypothetical protein
LLEGRDFQTEFLRKLRRRGLRGAKLVIAGAQEGMMVAVTKLMNSAWQRCRAHTMGNAQAHAGKSGRRIVSTFIATARAPIALSPSRPRDLAGAQLRMGGPAPRYMTPEPWPPRAMIPSSDCQPGDLTGPAPIGGP